jgi:prepilin-type N-terminal cleavage/methylation domain-containing protein
MKNPTQATRRKSAFSLIEMIGVLAIIAILASVVLPKVFSAITSARVTNTILALNTVKTGITEFTAKYGSSPLATGNARIDDLLITAGFMNERFTAKIGAQTDPTANRGATWSQTGEVWTSSGGSSQGIAARVQANTSNISSPSTAAGRNFRLDGITNLPAGSRVVYAVIYNVPGKEAQDMSIRLDGNGRSAANITSADTEGKVVYNTPNGTTGLTTVYVYVVHQ